MADKATLMQSLKALEKYANGDDSEVIVKHVKFANPPKYSPEQIKQIRSKIPATQRVFARGLAVSPRTVEAWETGRSKPSGSSRRLLELIDKDPAVFKLIMA